MKDEGEPALPGWKIWIETYFDDSENGFYLTGWDITDGNGYYEFVGLPPGTYLVWEVGQAGWVPTNATVHEVTVVGHSEIRLDFFNFLLGCVEGYKYEDMNGDGLLDDGDAILPGWPIYLSKEIGGELVVVASTVTDSAGHYMFCGLGPGHYMVSEGSVTGWTPTNTPTEEFVMRSGATVVIHVFLNFELGSICGYKFVDSDSDGVWDKDTEDPYEGWPIHLLRDSESEWITTYTDAAGRFCFTGLDAEYYMVWEEALPGWTNTTKDYMEVWVVSGTHVEVPPFGNFKNVDIEIFKYEDVNGNHVFDEGDDVLQDWEFEVSGPCFDVPLVLVTDDEGRAYATITAAGEYTITEEDRDGWIHTQPLEASTRSRCSPATRSHRSCSATSSSSA